MIKVGITGGIGSGKTTVCGEWESFGAFVVNADDLAKKVMVEHPEVRQEIKNVFGSASYRKDGSLNRKYLSREAFEKNRVAELNKIVHPRLPGITKDLMEHADKKGHPVFVYEAALLLQNGRPDFLDIVVLVLADEEKRIDWVRLRDKASTEEISQRIDKQQNFENLTHFADIVIKNDGSLEELKKKAKNIYQDFTS